MMKNTLHNLLLTLLLMLFLPPTLADTTAWQDVINGRNIVILRHAIAPGNGDPQDFDLKHCGTQRNLSATGRKQARHIGNMLKEKGILDAFIFSSQWCRCLETAQLMDIGNVQELPELNSFYNRPNDGPTQMIKLRRWLSTAGRQSKPVILVSHQVVISALTGIFPASGESIVFRTEENDGSVKVIERVPTSEQH